MMSFLVVVNMMLSLSTKSMTHPVSFMSIIIGQTLLLCIVSALAAQTPWFAMILFLIFLGGVMVLFIYMSSLASNENFLWEQKEFTFLLLSTGFTAGMLISTNNFPTLLVNNKSIIFLNFFYSVKFSPFMICLIVYLLVTLLIVSGVVKKNKSPMRSMK